MDGRSDNGVLNAVVKEYLKMLNFAKTVVAFEEEVKEKGLNLDESKLPPTENQSQNKIQNAMLEAFNTGNCQAFFRLWNKHLPEETYQNDNDCRRLEFNISLYFAIYPFFDDGWDKSSCPSSELALRIFKNYLETRGQSLSQTTEFVVFYALPFVPNPRDHPSFKVLFENGMAARTSQDKQQSMAQINALQQQAGLLEVRAAQYLKKYTKIQEDYHNLIGIAAELVDSLENSVRGKMVSPDYLQGVCERLFNNAQSNPAESVDFTRPGTAASMLRASIVTASVGNSISQDVSYFPSLNFEKIKTDLVHVTVRKKALILQALRWRLTKSQASDQVDAVIASYIANDILGCSMDQKHMNTITNIMSSRESILREYAARLFNTLASFTQGRTYMSESRTMVAEMFNALKQEAKASATSENLLGAMQKVSMRRDVQSSMISNGVVEWLLTALEELEHFSDYSLEYSVALLMNLCLRASGKKVCLPRAERTLKLLTDLMAHENQEIRPYLNGALYSILSLPTVRQKAVAMGLDEILGCFFQKDQPEMNRQIQFIINKINTNEISETDEPLSDEEEEDEDEDEEGDAVDPELDKDEPLVARKGELFGEKLLSEEYLAVLSSSTLSNGKGKKKLLASTTTFGRDMDKPISRPVTPASKFNLASIKESSSAPSPVRPESNGPEMERPRTQSSRSSRKDGERSQSRPTSGAQNPETSPKQEPAGSKPGSKQYGEVFASRPKIPRSPDLSARSSSRPGSGRPGSARAASSRPGSARPGSARPGSANRPGTASPPPPVRSASPTRASRPSSKGDGKRSPQHSRGKKAQ